MNFFQKKLNFFHVLWKMRSVGKPPFTKVKFDHIDFNVVFQNLLKKRQLNSNSFWLWDDSWSSSTDEWVGTFMKRSPGMLSCRCSHNILRLWCRRVRLKVKSVTWNKDKKWFSLRCPTERDCRNCLHAHLTWHNGMRVGGRTEKYNVHVFSRGPCEHENENSLGVK